MSKAEQATQKPNRVTLMSQARDLFAAQLLRWKNGDFKSEKRPYGALRKTLIGQFQKQLDVTVPSAATMFNNLRKQALADDPDLVLQRDPKIAKVKSTRGPGRPRATEQEAANTETEAA